MTAAAGPARNVLAWDAPTRIFKWTFVFLIADAWLSNKSAAVNPTWHKWNGYAILVAIVFRIFWGFFGGSTARFSHFVKPWKALLYLPSLLRIPGTRYLGHNPPGGLWIVAILAMCSFQGLLGLYSSDPDRIIIEGPLAHTIPDTAVDRATYWHSIGFEVILWLVVLHLSAVFFYDLVKRHGLIPAMVRGTKRRDVYADEPEAVPGSWLTASLCLLAAIVLVFGMITLLGGNVLK